MRIEIEPGIRLFVDVEGPGLVPDGSTMRERPTVLLLHGGPGFDHSGYKPQLSPLAEVAQLIYYDHRGHGRSDPRPRTEWTLDHWADDVVRLCGALGIVKPIVLGQSFGGMVAQHYLARHPHHPGKVILSSTSGRHELERKLAVFERLGGPLARKVARRYWMQPDDSGWAEYAKVCLPLYGRAPAGDDRMKRTILKTDILNTWGNEPLRSMNLLPGLSRAVCPVLVMGGEDDPVTPIEDQRDIAAALPRSCVRFQAFPGAGHGVWRDKPQEAMALMRRFILADD
ncbi:MAG: alpha/beta hydrolase [Rubrivivax sp.]|nr:alpha/beta hydrolase [Rubrivivax sp.]